jgi:hypothetical protein
MLSRPTRGGDRTAREDELGATRRRPDGAAVRAGSDAPVPAVENPDAVRPFFRALRDVRGRLLAQGVDPSMLNELSMGMSHDFEVAIEEGATLVRVGTALFGSRAYP